MLRVRYLTDRRFGKKLGEKQITHLQHLWKSRLTMKVSMMSWTSNPNCNQDRKLSILTSQSLKILPGNQRPSQGENGCSADEEQEHHLPVEDTSPFPEASENKAGPSTPRNTSQEGASIAESRSQRDRRLPTVLTYDTLGNPVYQARAVVQSLTNDSVPLPTTPSAQGPCATWMTSLPAIRQPVPPMIMQPSTPFHYPIILGYQGCLQKTLVTQWTLVAMHCIKWPMDTYKCRALHSKTSFRFFKKRKERKRLDFFL